MFTKSVFFFSSEFSAAASVPWWEREQCLSEIKATQRVGRERERGREGGREGKKGGGMKEHSREKAADNNTKSDFRKSLGEVLKERQRFTRETEGTGMGGGYK